ncbi:MAG: phytanoyl-CoA dioxygenase family protein [Actinomycetota bacterium]
MTRELSRVAVPHNWSAIHDEVRSAGGVIVEGLLDASVVDELNGDIDRYLVEHSDAGHAETGSELYDRFLGARTIRLHGLLDKIPSTEALLAHPELVAWAEQSMSDLAASVLLSAGEMIEIRSGEPAQLPHRDSDSWPAMPIGETPVVVNAIVALDETTLDNGATYVAPGSWAWPPERRAEPDEFARAVMSPGDALLFRGDVIHGGGENTSDGRRRVISVSYCAGWLRPVENSFLTVPTATAAAASSAMQGLLGYRAHDGIEHGGGMVGLYENGDPGAYLATQRER